MVEVRNLSKEFFEVRFRNFKPAKPVNDVVFAYYGDDEVHCPFGPVREKGDVRKKGGFVERSRFFDEFFVA